jgi:hypothetical protein
MARSPLTLMSAALTLGVLLAAVPIQPRAMVPPDGGVPPGSQLDIATKRFAEALKAVSLAHELMPDAVTKTVQYEELKANRTPACEKQLAESKTASSRARRDMDEARGKASNAFGAAKTALQKLGGATAEGAARLSSDLPWAAESGRIEASLKKLKSLYADINSAKTARKRALFWADTVAYCRELPKTWASAEPNELVPASVKIPCLGYTVEMHGAPAE